MRLFERTVAHFAQVQQPFQAIVQRKIRIALASSAKGDELQRYKEIANIADLVETETSADDAERSKPHPDIFEAALDKLGRPEPHAAVVIRDTPYDALAASKLGVSTVGVLCGFGTERELPRP